MPKKRYYEKIWLFLTYPLLHPHTISSGFEGTIFLNGKN